MKRIAILATTAALAVGIAACGGSSSNDSLPAAKPANTPVTVVMAEPGCHWFSTPSGNALKQTVNGPAILSNYDEAALDVKANGKQVLDGPIPVGGKATLSTGNYTITMVGQEPTDNTLHLTVN